MVHILCHIIAIQLTQMLFIHTINQGCQNLPLCVNKLLFFLDNSSLSSVSTLRLNVPFLAPLLVSIQERLIFFPINQTILFSVV